MCMFEQSLQSNEKDTLERLRLEMGNLSKDKEESSSGIQQQPWGWKERNQFNLYSKEGVGRAR